MRSVWLRVIGKAFLIVLAAALLAQTVPQVRRVEAQACGLNTGTTSTVSGTSAFCNTVANIFGVGLQVGYGGTPISLMQAVDISVTATTLNQFGLNTAIVTQTVNSAVTGTFSSTGAPLTSSAPTVMCNYRAFATATDVSSLAGFGWAASMVTGTSPATGTSALPLSVAVRFWNNSIVTNTIPTGTLRCLYAAY